MENKLANIICAHLLKNSDISEDLKDVYLYGFEILLSFIFIIVAIIIWGILTSSIITSIVYLIVFIIMRRFVGGFHATTHLWCQIISFITYIGVWLLTYHVDVTLIMIYILELLGLISILLLAPIENSNKPITNKQRKECKMYGFIIFSILSIVSFLAWEINIKLCNVIYYTQIAVVVLMILPILFRKEEKHEKSI